MSKIYYLKLSYANYGSVERIKLPYPSTSYAGEILTYNNCRSFAGNYIYIKCVVRGPSI